jgi:hypothetical protein
MDTGITQTESEQSVESPSAQSPLVTPGESGSGDVRGFLIKEIQSSSSGIKKTYWLGTTVVLFIMSYSLWIYSTLLSDVLNPDVLSSLIAAEAGIQAPIVIDSLRTEAESQIPVIIGAIKTKIFSETKGIRFSVDTHVDAVLEVMPIFREEMKEGLQVYFEDNREQFADFAETHSDEQFVEHFVSEINAEVGHQLEATLIRHKDIKAESLAQLASLNTEISTLASKNRFRMTEHEQLKRRVYASWLKVLEQYLEFSDADLRALAGE